ncbi:hypothetical protein [Streptomyces arboris]|uniref:hypothetical protein n=1 Tax=Streptomyces arboris TaxID=2600619 RepID=UPI003BF5C39C
MPSPDLTTPDAAAAAGPVAFAPGVLVHSRRDRELAAATWLVLAARDRAKAQHEWATCGVALLRCAILFSAARLPAAFVHEAAGTTDRDQVAEFLKAALDGGPVFYDGDRRYYALTPVSAARLWRGEGIEWLGSETFLGVPATDVTGPDPRCAAYWCVPMDGPAALCQPAAVVRLARRGRALVEQKEGDSDA